MNAPAQFLVARHHISHPGDSIADAARHLHLYYSVVKRAIENAHRENLPPPEQDLRAWVQYASRLRRKPDFANKYFYMPNPENWFQSYSGPYLESGERIAAERDGLNLIPEHFLVYVPASCLEAAFLAVLNNVGKVAPAKAANLQVRIADAWLMAAPDAEHVAERGQRLLDYDENPNIRLARSLLHA